MAFSTLVYYKDDTDTSTLCSGSHDTPTGLTQSSNGYLVWYEDTNPQLPANSSLSTIAGVGSITLYKTSQLNGVTGNEIPGGSYSSTPFDGNQTSSAAVYLSSSGMLSPQPVSCPVTQTTIGFSQTSYSFTESNSVQNESIYIAGAGVTQAVDISISINNSLSSFNSASFTLPNGNLTLASGLTSLQVPVQINPDANSDNETIVLDIVETTSPSTGATISPSQTTITITDDEGLISQNGNYIIDVYYKSDVTYTANGQNACLGNHDAIYGVSGTPAGVGAVSGQYRLYYSSTGNSPGLTLSQLQTNGITLFVNDYSSSGIGEPPAPGFVSNIKFDNTVAGNIAPWRLSGGIITTAMSTCSFNGQGYPSTKSLTAYFSSADKQNPNGEYCIDKQLVTFYYYSTETFSSIEEMIYYVSYVNTTLQLYVTGACPAPLASVIGDPSNYPGLRALDASFSGYFGDDLIESYIYDGTSQSVQWLQSSQGAQDWGSTTTIPNQDPSVSLSSWNPWECNPISTSATEIQLFYNSSGAAFCNSATLTTFYYYFGGDTLTFNEIKEKELPLFTDLDDAVSYYYCPRGILAYAPSGVYGENSVYYTSFSGSTWRTNGNCILSGNLTTRSIDVKLAACDSTTGVVNPTLAICQYPKETVTLYYRAALDIDLLTIAQFNIYLFTSADGATNSDYNLLVGNGSSIPIMPGLNDTSITQGKFLYFDGVYYVGRTAQGNPIATNGAIPNTGLADGFICPTVSKPAITQLEELSDGGYNAFYVFYPCSPSSINQNQANPFSAYTMYVVDGLHRFGETSPISEMISSMKLQGKLIYSPELYGSCLCLEYVHIVYSEDIESAKQLLENYYPNIADVHPSEIGIGSLQNISLFDDCNDCSTNTDPTAYQLSKYETPAPLVPGPNMDIEKNYKLDNVSKPLLRTNPKLSTNVKLVVDSDDRIFMDSFDANQSLADSKYKRYELSPESRYSYDLSRFYNDNNTPIDSTFDLFREYSDLSVLDQYRKQLEEMYQYGTKLNRSKLYGEEYRILAPIWLDLNVPKKFVIYRVNNPNPDVTLGESGDDKLERILKLVRNSEIVKVFDLSKSSSIGKYLRSHVQDEFFPKSPITVTMENNEKSTFNGIDLIKGGFVEKGEYLYNDFVKSDLTMIDANNFITDGFRRNKVACANLINLEFMFDDPSAEAYSVNRYFGLYVDDFDSGVGEVSYVQDGIIRFKSIDSYMGGFDPTFAIPEHRILRDSGLLAYAKIRDSFYTLDPLKTYDARRFNVSISAEDSEIKSKLGVSSKGVSSPIISNISADSDYIKFKIVGTPALNDSVKVSMIKKESVRFKIVNNVQGETITISDFAGNFVQFTTGTDSNDSWNNLSTVWSNIEDDIDNQTNLYSSAEHAFYNRYKLNLEITNQINSIVLAERNSNLIDNELVVNSNTATIIASNEIYTNINPTIGNFFADISGSLAKKRFNSDSFSGLGSTSDIAFALSSAIRNNSEFDAYNVGDFVYVKSKVNGYDLKNAVLLIRRSNQSQFIQAENYDQINRLKLGSDILSLFDAYYFTGGNSSDKSVFVPSSASDVIEVGDFIPTNYSGEYNQILHISDDTINRDGQYKKLVLKLKNSLKSRDYTIYANNRITLGLFSAYDIFDMDFDFYDTSNSKLKELELENSDNLYYEPYNYVVETTNPPSGTLSADNVISEDFIKNPIDYFGNLLPLLKDEDSTINIVDKIYTEYDRLKENYTKEYSTDSRVVPLINKWVLKDGTTVREEPYHLNINEAFGRTNFAPDITKEGRDPASFTHEWFYIDNWPSYFKPSAVDSLNIGAYQTEFSNGFSYINFVNDFEIERSLFTSTQYDYFDRFMVGEGTETIATIVDQALSVSYTPIIWSKSNKTKKYTLIDGGSALDFSSTIFKGLKYTFKKRKENLTDVPSEFVKNTEFNGYRFSVLAKTKTDSGTNSIDYEFIKNDKFKFIILMININIDDSFVNYINRKYLYELKHRIVKTSDTSGNDIYIYANVNIDGAIDVTNVQFNQPGPYIASGIDHNNGSVAIFNQQIAPGQDQTYGSIKINYGQSYTPGGEDIFVDVLNVVGKDQLQIDGPPYYIDNNTSVKVSLNPVAIPLNVQKSATYTYIGGGINAYDILFEKLSANYFYNLVKNNPNEIAYTTITENGAVESNLFSVELDNGNEIVKTSTLSVQADTNTPKTFKLSKDIIGYDIVSENPFYPFLIRHNGNYTIDLTPVVTFTDVYGFNKVIRNQKDYDVLTRALKEPYYNIKISSTYETSKSLAFYRRFNRLGVAFNLGFISDGGSHDTNWGVIKNHFYHKVNEINTLSVTKLSESSEYLPQYPLIGEIAIDKRDMNVFKSSWEDDYYIRSLSGGTTEPVPGTASTLEEKSYLGSSTVKTKESYAIYEFTSVSVQTESELDDILRNSNNSADIVFFEDDNNIFADFYMDGLIAKVIGEDGLGDTIRKFVEPTKSAGDKTTVEDDIILYALDNMVPLYGIDSIEIYTNKFKGSSSEIISTSSIDLIDNGGYESDNSYTYSLHGKKSLNFRLIYNKKLGYSYSIRALIKIQS